MVKFSCSKQEQRITIQITTPLHIKIPSSFKLIMDYWISEVESEGNSNGDILPAGK